LPLIDANAPVETQARLLSNWFVGQMADKDDRFWLVFDHLDRPAVRRESLFLIENLAGAAERGQLGDMRITLLGFNEVMSPAVERDSRREKIAEIGAPHLEKFFTDIASGHSATIEPAALRDAVDTVLKGATTNGSLDLEKLNEQVGVVAGALFEG
jgi:hypothetical protein